MDITKPKQLLHSRKVGMAPGSLVYVGGSETEQTRVQTHCYSSASYKVENGFANKPEQLVWIQISGLSDIKEIVRIAKEFAISNLSLEDVFSTNQRMKLDYYDNYISVTARILSEGDKDEEQLTLFVGKGWVLSIVEYQSKIFDEVARQLSITESKLRGGSMDMLFHALLDRVVDQYLVKADELDIETEKLEETVINNPHQTNAPAIHQHKAEILRLRRTTSPLKDMLSNLMRSESQYLERSTVYLLRDIYDHAVWLAEECDMLRDTVNSVMDVYLSSLDSRMNAIMKVLTIISTIFIPMTFLTGLYGMNFTEMPFTTARWGFYAILVLCVVVVVSMAWYFKRKRWW